MCSVSSVVKSLKFATSGDCPERKMLTLRSAQDDRAGVPFILTRLPLVSRLNKMLKKHVIDRHRNCLPSGAHCPSVWQGSFGTAALLVFLLLVNPGPRLFGQAAKEPAASPRHNRRLRQSLRRRRKNLGRLKRRSAPPTTIPRRLPGIWRAFSRGFRQAGGASRFFISSTSPRSKPTISRLPRNTQRNCWS